MHQSNSLRLILRILKIICFLITVILLFIRSIPGAYISGTAAFALQIFLDLAQKKEKYLEQDERIQRIYEKTANIAFYISTYTLAAGGVILLILSIILNWPEGAQISTYAFFFFLFQFIIYSVIEFFWLLNYGEFENHD